MIEGLQSDIRWIQTGEKSGWQNSSVKVIQN